ncbi:DUF305 domain-containing protein [Nocardioides caricicola]|uniref:DUF305 domain-containing protein n=2 Tax=Nocardioides caricicola TaxID=634770 RepID=A0ABW0MZL6_9ACTN
MSRRIAGMVAVVVVLLVGVTTAVAATVVDDDDRWNGRGGGMTSSQMMMFGGMHGMRAASEDVYLAEMVAHHEEAVAAAQQLRRSPRAEMREFGESIVASQSAQIDQMRQWLADWYPDRTEQVAYRPMMRDLTGLSGDRLDRAFLQDMIRHHMAAVMMSQQLLVRGGAEHDEVEALAEDIRDEQHAEIFQMQQWLRDWFGVGWQHGMHGGPWMMR